MRGYGDWTNGLGKKKKVGVWGICDAGRNVCCCLRLRSIVGSVAFAFVISGRKRHVRSEGPGERTCSPPTCSCSCVRRSRGRGRKGTDSDWQEWTRARSIRLRCMRSVLARSERAGERGRALSAAAHCTHARDAPSGVWRANAPVRLGPKQAAPLFPNGRHRYQTVN